MKKDQQNHFIPKEIVLEVIDKTDLVSIISQHLTLKKQGKNYTTCCPFHLEKTPSFTVNQDKQFYHCFGCGAHGNVIGFLRDHLGLSFTEAVRLLAQQAGISIPNEQQANDIPEASKFLKLCINYFHNQLWQHKPALAYLKKRQVSEEMIKRFQIGYANASIETLKQLSKQHPSSVLLESGMTIYHEDKKAMYPRFRQRIVFPIFNQYGIAVGFGARALGEQMPKYLNSAQSDIFDKGSILYGQHRLRQSTQRQSKSIIIVEGYMDVIALEQYGYPNAVAAMGTSVTRKQIKNLLQYRKKLAFCFDGDNAGRRAAFKTFENLLPELHDQANIFFVFLPEQQDPDDVLKKGGRDALQQIFKQALELDDYLLELIKTKYPGEQLNVKIQAYNYAKTLLNSIKSNIIKQFIEKKISQHLGVDSGHQVNTHAPVPTTTDKQHDQHEDYAFNILIEHPSKFSQINPKLIKWLKEHDQHQKLIKLIAHLEKHPEQSTAQIIEMIPNIPRKKQAILLECKDPAVELNHVFKRLIKISIDNKMVALTKENTDIRPRQEELKRLLDIKKQVLEIKQD